MRPSRANAAFELGTSFVVMPTAPVRVVVYALSLTLSILTGVATGHSTLPFAVAVVHA
jgi:hypothetical protein